MNKNMTEQKTSSPPLTASLILPNNLKVPTHPEPSPSPK